MTEKDISRRDFLNGMALSLAAGTALSPLEILARTDGHGARDYPPALTGMRGSHDGSFEVAHALARTGVSFPPPAGQTGSTHDLIVVGAGISGLSAAKFFRDRRDAPSDILVLDNHDDFGGHARRNEFSVDGKTLLAYGGSQTIDSPAKYSKVAKQLLTDLSIDVQRFYDYYDQAYYSSRGLKSGIYFDRATFGVDRVLADPRGGFRDGPLRGDELARVVGNMPIGEEGRTAYIRLLAGGVDYLEGRSVAEKRELLRNISYLDYLEKYAGMPESVSAVLQDTFLPLTSLGWESNSALEAADWWFPGTWELGVQEAEGDEEPYIFHFPDGNAGIARSLVRDLIPDAMPGETMEDLVTARADYSLLDTAGSDVRIRLNSTAVHVANTADGRHVDVTYVHEGSVHRARGRHVVLACYNNVVPHICPELPAKQADAIRYATKIPFVIGNIAIRNWRAFAEAGFQTFYSPGDVYFKYMPLDFPVSMGEYHFSKGPDEPIVISAWFSPTARGLPAREQYRAGREKLLENELRRFRAGYLFAPRRHARALRLRCRARDCCDHVKPLAARLRLRIRGHRRAGGVRSPQRPAYRRPGADRSGVDCEQRFGSLCLRRRGDRCRRPRRNRAAELSGRGMGDKLLLFDLGGVLADLSNPVETMALPMALEEFWPLWLSSPNVRAFETGALSVDEFCRRFGSELGLADQAFDEERLQRWRPALYPGVEDLLRTVARRNPIALLSNTNSVHWRHVASDTDVFTHFDGTYLSYEIGLHKPEPDAFRHVLEDLGLRPGDIAFFDDSKKNVAAANALGIDAHCVAGPAELETALRFQAMI